MKIKQYLATLLFFTVFSSNAASDDELPSFAFLEDSATYIYETHDGIKMYSHVVSCGDGYVEIEDAIALPKEIAPNGDPVVQDRYKLKIDNNEVIKDSARGQSILLQGPLAKNASSWSNTGAILEDGQNKKFTSTCQIIDISDAEVLGKQTSVVTVECKANTKKFEIETISQFARGIGLIERTTTTRTEGGDDFGAQSLKLVEIVPDQE